MVTVEGAEAEDKLSHCLDHTSMRTSCLHPDRNTSPGRLEGNITFIPLLSESISLEGFREDIQPRLETIS